MNMVSETLIHRIVNLVSVRISESKVKQLHYIGCRIVKTVGLSGEINVLREIRVLGRCDVLCF